MWKGVDCLRQRQQPGREYKVAKRLKEHSTGQSLQSEHGVSGEAIGSQEGDVHEFESLEGNLNVKRTNHWLF